MLLGIYSLRDIKYSTKEGLSYDEKKADAKCLMNFLEKTYPYFDEVKASTEQDLLKEKDRIVNSICKTSSDEEFYKEICELFERFTYGRTELSISTNKYDSEYTYLYENPETLKKSNLGKSKEINSKWEGIQNEYRDNLAKYQYACNIAASYINVGYYITMSQTPEVHVGDEVIGINGMSVDENGTYVGKIVVTPQVIIKDDTLKTIDNLIKARAIFGKWDKKINILTKMNILMRL